MKKIKKTISKNSEPRHIVFGVAFLVVIPLVTLVLPSITKTGYDSSTGTGGVLSEDIDKTDTRLVTKHVKIPDSVKAIYMTSCVAGTPSFRQKLVSLIEETELNSVVIDIKDYSGTVSFPVESEALQGAWENSRCGARDMRAFLEELHSKNIYIIGRITVFQDPYYSLVRPDLAVKRASDGEVWKDYKKLSFIDVGAKEYWDYIVELSKESYNLGFDELNFDYIRFPSDGNMKDIAFTHTQVGKAEQLEIFFSYLNEKLKDENLFADVKNVVEEGDVVSPVLSADLFGMTTTNTDDLNIGQVLERALPYFDYIAPMVYPSHYPTGFNGWADPNKHPYDVIHFSMSRAVERAISTTTPVNTLLGKLVSTSTIPYTYSKKYYSPLALRPWIQDFDYGGNYDVAEVKAQIQAVYDSGLNSWMIWSPSNIYTRGALEKVVE